MSMLERGQNLIDKNKREELIAHEQSVKDRLSEIARFLEKEALQYTQQLQKLKTRGAFEKLNSEHSEIQSTIKEIEEIDEIPESIIRDGLIVRASLKEFPGSCKRNFYIPSSITNLSQIRYEFGSTKKYLSQFDIVNGTIEG